MSAQCIYEHDHEAEPDECEYEIPYWECRYYLTCDNPNIPTESCSIGGCWQEPACITDQPIGGWKHDAGS